MTEIVGIMDYGTAGNLFNVEKGLLAAGARVEILRRAEDLDRVDRIVFPGVGSFPGVMNSLNGIRETLVGEIRRKPTLGICLGMQILAKVGFEFGETAGLGLIDAEVKKIEVKCKVPHLGWGRLDVVRDSPLLSGITGNDPFYFMHSYEMVNYTDVVALTDYCNHRFVSVIQQGHIHGVQFHPEKSREKGIQIFENFISL
jgi:imidazole glycerol-phosphate synthase subunit HisH